MGYTSGQDVRRKMQYTVSFVMRSFARDDWQLFLNLSSSDPGCAVKKESLSSPKLLYLT